MATKSEEVSVISSKIIAAIILGALACAAQTINISGTVQDSAGVGISGATVRLEEADISATTGDDGAFTLTKGDAAIEPRGSSFAAGPRIVEYRNGRLTFRVSAHTTVSISVHDAGGRQVYRKQSTYGAATHTIRPPLASAGIYLYELRIGNEAYSFKSSPSGAISMGEGASSSGASGLAKQAKASAVIADVIRVEKETFLTYRDSMRTSDTSGVIIMMLANAGNVTDANGNVYQSVRIGDQVWTVENLRATKYNDGTDIPHVADSSAWSNLSTPGYCFYDNSSDPTEQEKWGALYNWHAVKTGKLAPAGWRVPTDRDWVQLEEYLMANGYNWDGTTSGNKIAKAMAARTDWASFTTAGTIGNDLSENNASGFSALPGGYRHRRSWFQRQGTNGRWWSATSLNVNPVNAYNSYLHYHSEPLGRHNEIKEYGLSVRLVRDAR